jgi:hypothetical protein
MNGSETLGSTPIVGTAASNTASASGSVNFTTAFLVPGAYNITAVYSGDGNYAGSTSLAASVTIAKAYIFVGMTQSSLSISSNQSLQVTVAPGPPAGYPQPTGTATISYNGITTPAVNLVSGAASFTIPANSLWGGETTITGNYSGDTIYQQNSGSISVMVTPSGTIPPTVTVIPPTTKVTYPYSVTVTVSGPSGDPVPTGYVTLSGINTPYPMPLVNGSVTFTDTYGLNGVQDTLTATLKLHYWHRLGCGEHSGGSVNHFHAQLPEYPHQSAPDY